MARTEGMSVQRLRGEEWVTVELPGGWDGWRTRVGMAKARSKREGLCILEELGSNSGWSGKSLKRSVLSCWDFIFKNIQSV